ncbi:DUF2239 family protein [Pseudooceanicola sp. C21-150M6]|uniref:DUF2239 family protein n=1 Tax=Pseudooceanicola sp. C21-150M6 TaxID=3434355 RepID=UPI003D7F62A5
MTEQFTAFSGSRIVARGTRAEVAQALIGFGGTQVLIFSDATGRESDLDLSGGPEAVAERYADAPRRGRPKLGVVAREVTLLPRHWDWLATQRGGASATLRRLIEAASAGDDAVLRRDACYRFCSAIAGNLPGFEEAMRALYAGRSDDFITMTERWPGDIHRHALTLAGFA